MIGFVRIAVASLLVVVSSIASAAIIYFSDVQGHVGRYDDVTFAIAPVGNASASFGISQVIGLAWDPAGAGRILLFDRNNSAVYAMNPVSGATTLLFNPSAGFQGGAVVGNSLFGIDEGTQTVKAYNLTTFANLGLAAPALSSHTHGMGVNPATGQLYVGVPNAPFTIRTVSALGVEGPVVVTASPANFYDDIDYYGGDFLGSDFSNNLIVRINGVTGVTTQFLSTAQLTSGGLTTNVGGVVVAGAAAPPPQFAPVPTLNDWGLILLGVLVAASAIPLRRRFRG